MNEDKKTELAEEFVVGWLDNDIEYLDVVEALAEDHDIEDEDVARDIYYHAAAISSKVYQYYIGHKEDFR